MILCLKGYKNIQKTKQKPKEKKRKKKEKKNGKTFEVHLVRRTTEDSSSGCIIRLVPVFILDNQTHYERNYVTVFSFTFLI